MAPEPGDTAELVGLRCRPDLNGRRVEVKSRAAGKDGTPRYRVQLLESGGGGEVVKVKAANLKLSVEAEQALETLLEALLALGTDAPATPAPAPEDWRDWAGGLPMHVLVKIAKKYIAQADSTWAAQIKITNQSNIKLAKTGVNTWGLEDEEVQKVMEKRKHGGNCLFPFAMVCQEWRKAQQKVGGQMRMRADADVLLWGRVELAAWALREGCPRKGVCDGSEGWSDSRFLANVAAGFGHLELVQALCKEQGFDMDVDTIGWAAFTGNLELVKWLRSEGCPWDGMACSRAAICGHLHVLKWLRANRCPWDGWTCDEAARHGQLELLRWAVENGCEVDEEACVVAAQCGHLEVLQWMRANAWRANSCPWDKDILIKGAQGGSLEVIQWLRVAQRCRWSPEAIEGAARRGHLDAVKWLRANGCPWDAGTCSAAAIHGHLEILRWALENGCEWNAEVCAMSAASTGRLEVLQWMRAEGRPLTWGFYACHSAVEYGQVEVLRWARANGAPWTAATRDKAAAKFGYTDGLGNLVE